MKEGTSTSNENRFRHFCRTPAAFFFTESAGTSVNIMTVFDRKLSVFIFFFCLTARKFPNCEKKKKRSHLETQTVNCALRTSSGSDFTSSSSRQTNKQTNKQTKRIRKNWQLLLSFPLSARSGISPRPVIWRYSPFDSWWQTLSNLIAFYICPGTIGRSLSSVIVRNCLPRRCSLSNVIAPQHLPRRH